METEEKTSSTADNAGNVRVLSKQENFFYDGITIEGGDASGHKTYKTADYMNNFRIKNVAINSDSLLGKVILTLVVTGLVFFALFVALPIILVVLGVILTIWLLLSFFQKR